MNQAPTSPAPTSTVPSRTAPSRPAPDAAAPMSLLLGARRSPLAVAQAEWVADRLRAAGHHVELVGITSAGDTDRRALTEIGGTGVFATAVRDALATCQVDLVVHSLKDLPVAPGEGITLAAVPARELVTDVLVGQAPDQWEDTTVIGCGSPRRTAQLLALVAARGVRPQVVPIRGNVDTRIDQVAAGHLDATVLARAGLVRLSKVPSQGPLPDALDGVPVHELDLDAMLPAPGQAALAVECRSDDDAVIAALAGLDDAVTRAAVTAERSFLSRLEAGCLAPVGAHGRVVDGVLTLDVVVADGDRLVRLHGSSRASEASTLGSALAVQALTRLDGLVKGDD